MSPGDACLCLLLGGPPVIVEVVISWLFPRLMTALIFIIPSGLPRLGIPLDSGDGTGSRGQDTVEMNVFCASRFHSNNNPLLVPNNCFLFAADTNRLF